MPTRFIRAKHGHRQPGVQTFLPHPDLGASAAALDDRRLGKQRVEVLQILRALHLEDYGWATHPAVTMWRGHARGLIAYGLAVVEEWIGRGHRDTTGPMIAEFALPGRPVDWHATDPGDLPPWWGREDLHASHRAALLRKEPESYGHFAEEDDDRPYVWPGPPQQATDPLPFSAWLVRADDAAARQAQIQLGIAFIGPEHGIDAGTPKRRRQRTRFTEEVSIGDRIALSDGVTLEVGQVQGPAVVHPGGGLARRVSYSAQLRRDDLRRPWQLQDPAPITRLRGERGVER